MKPRPMGLFVDDLRGSHIRARARRLGRRELWFLYEELLLAIHNAGGALPADPESLADETDFFSPEEIAELLPLLAPAPGKRGGIVVENGFLRNPRIDAANEADAAWRAERARDGKLSAESRRRKIGTAQPQKTPKVSEGTFGAPEGAARGSLDPSNGAQPAKTSKVPSAHPEGTFGAPEGTLKPSRRSLEPSSSSSTSTSNGREEEKRARADRSDRPLFPDAAVLAEGHGHIRVIEARDGIDPVDVVRRASWWNGSELLQLESAGSEKRLAYTVARLRTWATTGRTPEQQRAEGPAPNSTPRTSGARPPTASERVETERQRGADLLAQEQAERRRRLLGDQAPAAAPALPPGGSR